VPQSASDYWIFLRGVVVDDGEMLTVALNNQANAAEVATQTLTIDMGATDQVGFGGANVALNQRWTGTCTGGVYEADEEGKTTLTLNTALDRSWWIAGDGKRARYLQITGVGTFLVSTYVDTTHIRVTGNASAASDSAYSLSEEGDTFDVGINVRPVANKVDVFWTNLTTGQGSQSSEPYKLRDIITRGHACSAGTPTRHATAYACTLDPAWITISGADTAINKIEVAYRPLLILGDSQTITLPSALEAPEAYRLGSAMLTAMSNDRVGWLLGASGAYLSSDGSGVCEALYKKYVNATPGLGDGCEMSGVVLLFAAGVNEISTIIGGATPTTEQRNKAVGVLSEGAGRILSELYSQALDGGAGDGRHAIICGLPRFPGSATPTEEQIAQDTAVKCWNYALEGLAAGCSATFYNHYSLGTSIISTSDYVHYTTEGATTVAGKIANIYEQGAWPRTAGGQKWIEW